MVIKGGARGGPDGLAAHLLRTDHNERVTLLDITGVNANDLREALFQMDAIGAEAMADRTLYHASINSRPGEVLTREQQRIAVDRLEAELGLTDQPRLVVEHVKARKGQEADQAGPHLHVVWSRIDLEKMTAIPDSHNFHKHQKVARDLEREFGFEPVRGTHHDNDGPRPPHTPTHAEYQQAGRSGIDPRDAHAFLSEAWQASGNGQEFAAGIEREGWILARGNRRGYVALDPAGEVHAINKKVTGLVADAVRDRMADIDLSRLPGVAEAKAMQRDRSQAEIHHQPQAENHQPANDNEAQQARIDAEQRQRIRDDIREIRQGLTGANREREIIAEVEKIVERQQEKERREAERQEARKPKLDRETREAMAFEPPEIEERRRAEQERQAQSIAFALAHGMRPPAVDPAHAREETRPETPHERQGQERQDGRARVVPETTPEATQRHSYEAENAPPRFNRNAAREITREELAAARADADRIQREIRSKGRDATFTDHTPDASFTEPTPDVVRTRAGVPTTSRVPDKSADRAATLDTAAKGLDAIASAIGRFVGGIADAFTSIFEAPPQRQQPQYQQQDEPQPKPYQWTPPQPAPTRRSRTEDMLDEIRRTKGDRSPTDELRDELGRGRERQRNYGPDF